LNIASTVDQDDIATAIVAAKKALSLEQFDEALNHVQGVLQTTPQHVEALYVKAVIQRYAKRNLAGLKTVAKLKQVVPEYGRAFQEEGYNYRDLDEASKALPAFRKACEFNPGLEGSWKAQAVILRAQNRHIEAENAQGFHDRLKKLPPALHAVTNFLYEGELVKAEQICKQYLQTDKQNVEGIRLLAGIAMRMGVNNQADFLYETALELAPNNVMVRMDFVEFLRKTQKPAKAIGHAKYLNDKYPGNPMLQNSYAVQSMLVGDYETAFEMFDAVLAITPNNPGVLASKGHALKTVGRQDEAIESYRKAYQVYANYGDAYFSLANLKTYRFTDNEVRAMQDALKARDNSLQNQAHFHFSLGKAFEDKKDFATAFEHYKLGNIAKHTLSRYDAEKMSSDMQAQIETCTADLFKIKAGLGHDAPDPIFIVGLPRAGSTLLEQILASHSQVDGTLELPNILTLANRLRGRGVRTGSPQNTGGAYPQNLHDLPDDKLKEFGQAFIEDTMVHRQGAPFFIDKMPNNFRHIGLIHLILPNAKIIDARRHPMACCFSGFKQHFAEGQEFTYGLTQVGQYYRDYVGLMDHWDEVLPGKILRVQYEDVVADTETQVRRILDYLDLPFEQGCVEFHKTERSVRTASSEQVRQPIFKSGLEQWRNFEPWLDPLKEALGPVLKRYPI